MNLFPGTMLNDALDRLGVTKACRPDDIHGIAATAYCNELVVLLTFENEKSSKRLENGYCHPNLKT